MLKSKQMHAIVISSSEEIDSRLNKSRHALLAAVTSSAVSGVIDGVQGIINDIDDLIDEIADEIRQEADNIDRTRTKQLFAQKSTMQQLLTEAEGLRAKAEEKLDAARRSEEDAAARALAEEGDKLAAEQRELYQEIARSMSELVAQLDLFKASKARMNSIHHVVRNQMQRHDLGNFKVIDADDLGNLSGSSARNWFDNLVADHSEMERLLPFLVQLSKQMKSR